MLWIWIRPLPIYSADALLTDAPSQWMTMSLCCHCACTVTVDVTVTVDDIVLSLWMCAVTADVLIDDAASLWCAVSLSLWMRKPRRKP